MVVLKYSNISTLVQSTPLYLRCRLGGRSAVSVDDPDKVTEISDHRERCQKKFGQLALKNGNFDYL